MNAKNITTILVVMTLTLFSAANASAQTEHQHDTKKPPPQASKQDKKPMQHDMSQMDMSAMMNEPHHVLARAYMENIGTFAKALRDQAQGSSPLNADFARAAIAEIRRSLDEMEKHHQEHMQGMSADMKTHMAAMMKDMEAHRTKLKAAVAALEKDIQASPLVAKQVAADSADLVKHLDDMSKMHSTGKANKT